MHYAGGMNTDAMPWNYKPPSKTKAREGEPVWTLMKGARHLTCEPRYHGEYGVEVLVLRHGELHARVNLVRFRENASARELKSAQDPFDPEIRRSILRPT